MFIYGVPASPFVQRVLMVGRAKGHEVELRPMPGMALDSPEFQAISPMGRIPLLELDDRTHICESSAIAAYLDEVLDGPALLPADLVARARMREIEAVATLEYVTGIRPLMIHKVWGRPGGDEVVAAARVIAAKAADVLDRMLARSTAFAVGDRITHADCILAPALNLALIVDRMAETGALVRERPNLSAYFDRMAADPVAGRSIAEMTAAFTAMLARAAQPKG
ncbi:MAG TPA: glutathione S-transferase family protein [Sphingomonas sp.]|nr:glutathione S-transferase family protein [Sphingomonas sp.]